MKRVLTLLAALVVLAVTASPVAADQEHGRTIRGGFCLNDHLFCMSASVDGQAPVEGYGVDGNGGTCAKPPATTDPPAGPQYCVPSGTGRLTIRPGTYWITVDDTLNSHNFELRSCPGSTTACRPGQGSALTELTPVCNDDPANADVFKCSATNPFPETAANDIAVTLKIKLTPGTYRLFCDALKPVVHENAGMYIDIHVRGVGQVGD
jgi:hypothetical protein